MTEHDRKLVRCRRIETAVTRLQRLGLIYSYGGGRSGGHIVPPPGRGRAWTDCSGLGLYLAAAGDIHLENGAGSTWSMAEEGQPGTSPYFTWFIKNDPGDEHVIIRLRRRPRRGEGEPRFRWAQCGGRDNPRPGGGPTWFKPTKSRIEEFGIHRHFEVL